jgi:RNA ligase
MNITWDDINPLVAKGYLNLSRHPHLPLTVVCYTRTCQFDRAWDDVTKACRGLVIHDDGRIVGRGLPKFFAYGDPLVYLPPRTEFFTTYDKADGSLIHVTEYEGELLTWTKGSFTTPHAEEALKYLQGWKPRPNHTGLFEGVFGFNRVVVNYGEFRGLILIGDVHNETGVDGTHPADVAEDTGWHGEMVVERSSVPIDTFVQLCSDPLAGENREGFVVVWPSKTGPSHRIKIKFDRYLALHRTMTNLTERRVHEALIRSLEISLVEGDEDGEAYLNEFLDAIPDEMDSTVRRIADKLLDAAQSLLEAPRTAVKSVEALTERKLVAEAFSVIPKDDAGLAWMLYDNQYLRAGLQALRRVQSATEPILADG